MQKKLNVQWFIEQHSDWEKLLSEKPYCLTMSREQFNGMNLLMLKYSQVDSDFNEPIVRECRGLILNGDTMEIVSFPFRKFGNYSEGGWVDQIDWTTAKTTEKIDGSLMKIVNVKGSLLISTNGTILADKAPIAEQIGCKYTSFGQIAREVLASKNIDASAFEEGCTYMFELCSPWTRVVVPWHSNDLFFLGVRNNETFEETFFADHPLAKLFNTPKVFPLKSIDDCLAAAKDLPWDNEGYVVVDAAFHRNKVKSIAYLAAHHLKNNGVMSYARAIDLVRLNEVDEVLAYFPEFKAALEDCKQKFWNKVAETEAAWEEYQKIDASLPTRKDKALWITKNFSLPGIAFGLLDKKISSVKAFFMEASADRVVKMLGYKE